MQHQRDVALPFCYADPDDDDDEQQSKKGRQETPGADQNGALMPGPPPGPYMAPPYPMHPHMGYPPRGPPMGLPPG